MIRNTLAVLAALAMAATSHAGMLLSASAGVPLADTATSTGLVAYTISINTNAGETANGIAALSLTPQGGSLGAHQVFTAITNGATPTRQEQLSASPALFNDSGWTPYDTYTFFTAANSLKVGTGEWTETRAGTGATLPQGTAAGPANTGFGGISTGVGGASRVFTVASGLAGSHVPFMQIVMRSSDTALLGGTLINTAGDQIPATVLVGVPEPATLSMLGLAMVGCIGFFRRRSA